MPLQWQAIHRGGNGLVWLEGGGGMGHLFFLKKNYSILDSHDSK